MANKPYPEFPLFCHSGGQWAKTIRYRHYYFGPWADWKGASQNYRARLDAIMAGTDPACPRPTALRTNNEVIRGRAGRCEKFTVGEICSHSILLSENRTVQNIAPAGTDARHADRRPLGKITHQQRAKWLSKFAHAVRPDREATDLPADVLARARAVLSENGTISHNTVKRRIGFVRTA